MLAEGGSEAGHGTGTAAGGGLALKAGEGGQPDPGLPGEDFSGEAVEVAELA
jgi:hypothetical protein